MFSSPVDLINPWKNQNRERFNELLNSRNLSKDQLNDSLNDIEKLYWNIINGQKNNQNLKKIFQENNFKTFSKSIIEKLFGEEPINKPVIDEILNLEDEEIISHVVIHAFKSSEIAIAEKALQQLEKTETLTTIVKNLVYFHLLHCIPFVLKHSGVTSESIQAGLHASFSLTHELNPGEIIKMNSQAIFNYSNFIQSSSVQEQIEMGKKNAKKCFEILIKDSRVNQEMLKTVFNQLIDSEKRGKTSNSPSKSKEKSTEEILDRENSESSEPKLKEHLLQALDENIIQLLAHPKIDDETVYLCLKNAVTCQAQVIVKELVTNPKFEKKILNHLEELIHQNDPSFKEKENVLNQIEFPENNHLALLIATLFNEEKKVETILTDSKPINPALALFAAITHQHSEVAKKLIESLKTTKISYNYFNKLLKSAQDTQQTEIISLLNENKTHLISFSNWMSSIAFEKFFTFMGNN
jgi:hypothetical protein